MPSLKEFRAMLRRGIGNTEPRDLTQHSLSDDKSKEAEAIKEFLGFPSESASSSIDLSKLKRAPRLVPPRYVSSSDGEDAILYFGKYRDLSLSMIFEKEPTYLAWIIETFSSYEDDSTIKLIEITRQVINEKTL